MNSQIREIDDREEGRGTVPDGVQLFDNWMGPSNKQRGWWVSRCWIVNLNCYLQIYGYDSFSVAWVLFKAGKNHDGYFDNNDIIKQTKHAMNIFGEWCNRFATGLFLFDNAPSHQKCAPNTLSAQKMPKNPHATWCYHKDGPKMHATTFGPAGTHQTIYYSDDHPIMPGWFKGMEMIIRERGLWPEKGLNAQCEGFTSVNQGERIVAVEGYYFPSLIVWIRSHILKSLSHCVIIFVTSIQNITVSWISSNSIGRQQSFITETA